MNEETKIEKMKEYITKRINWEIAMGEQEERGKKGKLKLNDKISRWKQRLIRINAQVLYFCDNLDKKV